MPITFFHILCAIAKCPLPPPCPELFLLNTTSRGVEYPLGQFGSAIQAVSPASLLLPPAYLLLQAEGRNKTLAPRVGSKTYWDIPEHASNLVELVCDLTEGCLAYPSERCFGAWPLPTEPLVGTITGAEEGGPVHLRTPWLRQGPNPSWSWHRTIQHTAALLSDLLDAWGPSNWLLLWTFGGVEWNEGVTSWHEMRKCICQGTGDSG